MVKTFYQTILLSAVLLIVLIAGLFTKAASDRELTYQKRRLAEFHNIINEYRKIKEELSKTEVRLKDRSLIEEINLAISTTGLKGKIKAIKQAPGKKGTPFGEIEEAELIMERLTMNELANLLYQIDQRRSMTISRLNIKRAFDAPELLSFTMMLSSLKEK